MRAMIGYARPLACLLILAHLSLWLPQHRARAAMVTTEPVITSAAEPQERQSDRQRVRAFLDREEVRAQIEAYGLSPDEAVARVDSLTDREIAEIVDKLDALPAAGAGEAAIVALFAAVLVATAALFVAIFYGLKELGEAIFD